MRRQHKMLGEHSLGPFLSIFSQFSPYTERGLHRERSGIENRLLTFGNLLCHVLKPTFNYIEQRSALSELRSLLRIVSS